MRDSTRKKLSRLTSKPALIGWLLILKPITQFLAGVADLDFYITVGGNPRFVAAWNFFATPKGNVVLIAVAFLVLVYLVVKPEKEIPASEGTKALAGGDKKLLEEMPIPTVLSARRREVDTNAVPAKAESITAEPNLICTSTVPRSAYIQYNILVEGYLEGSYGSSNSVVIVAEITNEFLSTRAVADIEGISAEIVYQALDGRTTKVKRGSWLNESAYQLDFSVNDSRKLIIAFVQERKNEHVFFLTRELTNSHDNFENRVGLLEGDYHQVKVRLISEAERKLYKEFEFIFTITREPELDIELVEVKELTPQEIRKQLETFLGEGSDLLKNFPREKQAKPEDIAKVDDWEERVVRYLVRCPDQFSTTLFLADYPEVLLGGGAQSSNWPSLKKLSRRLATLREFIDELRRG